MLPKIYKLKLFFTKISIKFNWIVQILLRKRQDKSKEQEQE